MDLTHLLQHLFAHKTNEALEGKSWAKWFYFAIWMLLTFGIVLVNPPFGIIMLIACMGWLIWTLSKSETK